MAQSSSALADPASGEGMRRVLFNHATNDVDEQAALLNRWNQTYDQISHGRFEGALGLADFGTVQLFREVTGQALHQTGFVEPGVIAIGIPLHLNGKASFCGELCGDAQVHVFSGQDGFEFRSPRGLDMAGIILNPARLHTGPDKVRPVGQAQHKARLLQLDRRSFMQVRTRLLKIWKVIGAHPVLSGAECSALSCDLLLIAETILAATECEEEDRLPEPDRRANLVREACRLVQQQPDEFIRIADISRALGTSRRTLQFAFNEMLGVGPLAYLRAVRLNGARRAIRQSRSVSDAAVSWGFWHFGRFSRDYKTMFGELPSQTHRKRIPAQA